VIGLELPGMCGACLLCGQTIAIAGYVEVVINGIYRRATYKSIWTNVPCK